MLNSMSERSIAETMVNTANATKVDESPVKDADPTNQTTININNFLSKASIGTVSKTPN